jgi:hypothetical protein
MLTFQTLTMIELWNVFGPRECAGEPLTPFEQAARLAYNARSSQAMATGRLWFLAQQRERRQSYLAELQRA